jgi:hypothetical protein
VSSLRSTSAGGVVATPSAEVASAALHGGGSDSLKTGTDCNAPFDAG